MAISHLCLQCGFDLARVRPQRDPYYGLPLVHCPKCETAAVRRRHPVWRGWRESRRVVWSLFQFVFRVGFTLGLMIISCGLVSHVFEQFMKDGITDYDLIRFILPEFVMLSLVTGFWLAAVFRHGKQWRVWAVWMLLMIPSLQLTVLLTFQDQIFGRGLSLWEELQLNSDSLSRITVYAIPLFMMYGCVMVVALMGIPLGKLWMWNSTRRRGIQWRTRRRKLRLARTS